MLTFTILSIFIKVILQNHILFWLLILLLHQIILHVLERILEKQYIIMTTNNEIKDEKLR